MMISLDMLPVDEFDGWRDAARKRIAQRERASGLRLGGEAVARAERMLSQVFSHGYPADDSDLLRVGGPDGPVGSLWVWRSGSRVVILDTDLPEGASVQDLRTLRALVREWVTAAGAETLSIEAFRGDTSAWQFVQCDPFMSSSIQMLLDPLPERGLAGDALSLSLLPMTPARFAQYVRASANTFAASLLAAGGLSPEEADAEALEQFEANLPRGLETSGQHLYAVHAAAQEIGILWVGMQDRAGGQQAFVFDIEVAKALRGNGYGRAIMLSAEQEARRLGATSVGLHVFADNTPAVRLYESLGYHRAQEYLFLS